MRQVGNLLLDCFDEIKQLVDYWKIHRLEKNLEFYGSRHVPVLER